MASYKIPWFARVFSAGQGLLESPSATFPLLYWWGYGRINDAETAVKTAKNEMFCEIIMSSE